MNIKNLIKTFIVNGTISINTIFNFYFFVCLLDTEFFTLFILAFFIFSQGLTYLFYLMIIFFCKTQENLSSKQIEFAKIFSKFNFVFIFYYTVSLICKETCYKDNQENLHKFFINNSISSLILLFYEHCLYGDNNTVNEVIVRVSPSSPETITLIIPTEFTFRERLKGVIIDEKIKEENKEEDLDYKIDIKENFITCPICFDEYSEEEKSILLVCNHFYHYKCLLEAYKNNIKKCPMCRIDYV